MFRDGRSLANVLKVLRNTPIGSGLPSPATLLQGRQLRTQMAIEKDAYLPQHRNVQVIVVSWQCTLASCLYIVTPQTRQLATSTSYILHPRILYSKYYIVFPCPN